MSQEIDLWVIDSYTKKVPTIKDSKSRRCCNNSVGKSPRRKKERERALYTANMPNYCVVNHSDKTSFVIRSHKVTRVLYWQ